MPRSLRSPPLAALVAAEVALPVPVVEPSP